MSDDKKTTKLAEDATTWLAPYLEKLEEVAGKEASQVRKKFFENFLYMYGVAKDTIKTSNTYFQQANAILFDRCSKFAGNVRSKISVKNPLRAEGNVYYFFPSEIAKHLGEIFAFIDSALPNSQYGDQLGQDTISSFKMLKRALDSIGIKTHFLAKHISETYKEYEKSMSPKKRKLFAELEAIFN
ncbi:hypothetical protein HYX13_05000 [Candidatus Woesearchaeota archaeon]|nr:hypothetical protein [Candidatus Woesearchaeota archaeon]